MQISFKGFITCKKGELYSDCRDNYSYNTDNNKFAISDGVSKSFFPGIWSQLLTENFVNDHPDFITKSQEEWLKIVTERVNKPDVKYYTKNAFNRKQPGLATFVGLKFSETDKTWSAEALGDSFLFFVPKSFRNFDDECIRLSSKPEPIEFDNFPDYYSSYGSQHKGSLKPTSETLSEGTFYLMTDALAEWFIKHGESAVGMIEVWQSQNDFERFVSLKREDNDLGNDDSAILIIRLTDDRNEKLSYTEENVTKLNSLIAKQDDELANKPHEEVNSLEADSKISENDSQTSVAPVISYNETEHTSEKHIEECSETEKITLENKSLLKTLFPKKEWFKGLKWERHKESKLNAHEKAKLTTDFQFNISNNKVEKQGQPHIETEQVLISNKATENKLTQPVIDKF